jgi:hypothetical protein
VNVQLELKFPRRQYSSTIIPRVKSHMVVSLAPQEAVRGTKRSMKTASPGQITGATPAAVIMMVTVSRDLTELNTDPISWVRAHYIL